MTAILHCSRGAARTCFPASVAVELADAPRGQLAFLPCERLGLVVQDLGHIVVTYQDGDKQTSLCAMAATRQLALSRCMRNGEVVWTGENRSAFVGLYRSAYPLATSRSKASPSSPPSMRWADRRRLGRRTQPPRDMSAPFYIVATEIGSPLISPRTSNRGRHGLSWRLDAPVGNTARCASATAALSSTNAQPASFSTAPIFVPASLYQQGMAERLADRIAAYGFNVLRLHHHDGGMVMKDNTTRLNPETIDQLDYLIHCLKQRGIYITTDLYISRRLPKGEIPEYPDVLSDITAYKAMFWLLDSVWHNWRNYCEKLPQLSIPTRHDHQGRPCAHLHQHHQRGQYRHAGPPMLHAQTLRRTLPNWLTTISSTTKDPR